MHHRARTALRRLIRKRLFHVRRRYLVALFLLVVALAAAALTSGRSVLLDTPVLRLVGALELRDALHQTVRVDTFDEDGYPVGNGTGIIVGDDLIVTCWHVVQDRAYVVARTVDGRELAVRSIVDTLGTKDLALLRTSRTGKTPVTIDREFHDDEGVVALGYSKYAYDTAPDIAYGNIMGVDVTGQIRVCTLGFPGFSGSGLFDEDGNLVGIGTAISDQPPLFFFATPAEDLHRLLSRERVDDVHTFPPRESWPLLCTFLMDRTLTDVPGLGVAVRALAEVFDGEPDTLYAWLRFDPNDVDAHRRLLVHALLRSDMDTAVTELRILELLVPRDEFVATIKCVEQALAGDFEAAVEVADAFEAGGGQPGAPLLFTRGLMLVYLDRPREALRVYERLRDMESDLAEELFRRVYPNAPDPADGPVLVATRD